MKKNILKTTLFSIVTAALVSLPAVSRAEDATNNTPVSTHAAKNKDVVGYHGPVVSADAGAMSFVVDSIDQKEKVTVVVASTSKITKDGQPAVFSDIVAGANVSGSYKKDADGKNVAKTVRLGDKKKKAKKQDAAATK